MKQTSLVFLKAFQHHVFSSVFFDWRHLTFSRDNTISQIMSINFESNLKKTSGSDAHFYYGLIEEG